ncbi:MULTISPECIES: hypothetical protein [unclassified Streptomyces]
MYNDRLPILTLDEAHALVPVPHAAAERDNELATTRRGCSQNSRHGCR